MLITRIISEEERKKIKENKDKEKEHKAYIHEATRRMKKSRR